MQILIVPLILELLCHEARTVGQPTVSQGLIYSRSQ